MAEYKTPAVAFCGVRNPKSLYRSIDKLITSKGGNKVLNIDSDFHAYDIPQKGAVLLQIYSPPAKLDFMGSDEEIDGPVSGIVMLLGFQVDEFYNELYSTLVKLQE